MDIYNPPPLTAATKTDPYVEDAIADSALLEKSEGDHVDPPY